MKPKIAKFGIFEILPSGADQLITARTNGNVPITTQAQADKQLPTWTQCEAHKGRKFVVKKLSELTNAY